MIIDAYILCFNEKLMVRHTLNYYLTFCNTVTILDNYSTDKTLQIIKSEYPQVVVTQFDTKGEAREDIQTELKNNCWKNNTTADYVIVCDMDELLYAQNIHQKIEELKKYQPAICVVTGYEMFSKRFPKKYKKSIIEQVKMGVKNNRFDKTIIFSPKKVKEINYDFGAHNCYPELYKKGVVDYIVEFKLLHFKFVGRNQLIRKHKKYQKKLSKVNHANGWGIEYLKGAKYIKKAFKKAKKHKFKIVP